MSSVSANISIDLFINQLSLKLVLLSVLLIAALFLLIYLTKNREELKKYFFLAISVPVILTTIFLAGSTVYLNLISETKGPVHWHADFEFYYCGQKLNLADPKGFSNRIGSTLLHEHNDNRIHVEGVVVERENISFGSFIYAIGGKIAEDSLTLPTANGDLVIREGDQCSDGSFGEVNAFLYKVEGKNVGRSRFSDLNELGNHIINPSTSVPPGDCIIVEFGSYKGRTEKICTSYKTQLSKGVLKDGN